MGRALVQICTRCEGGETLHERVRALRKSMSLKDVFKLDDVKCLGVCEAPCAVEFSKKRGSTYLRVHVRPKEAATVVALAHRYALLAPLEEIPERDLVGESGD